MMCTIVHSQSIAAITRGAVATSLFALNMTNVTNIMDPLLSVKSKGKGCAERETEHNKYFSDYWLMDAKTVIKIRIGFIYSLA